MSEIHILGHCNATLAVLIDALGVSGEAIARITVVCNIPVTDDTPWQPHEMFGYHLEEIHSDQWDGKFQRLVLGVSKPATKRIVVDAFKRSHGVLESDYSCVFHPAATFSPQARIGHGVFLAPGTVVAPFASIGDFVSVNRNASIGHHSQIGAFTSINPGCHIAGKCEIGEDVSIGIGAIILDKLTIGSNTVIGAGSVVTRSLPRDVVALGTPAKVVKSRGELQ